MSFRRESLTTFIGDHRQLVRLAVSLGALAANVAGDFTFFRLKPRKIILRYTTDASQRFGPEHLLWFAHNFPDVSMLFEEKSSEGELLDVCELRRGRGGTIRDGSFDSYEDPTDGEDEDALDQLIHQHSVDCARRIDSSGEYALKVRVLEKYAPLDPCYGSIPYQFARARSAGWTRPIEFFGPPLPLMEALAVHGTEAAAIDPARAAEIGQTYQLPAPPAYPHIFHYLRNKGFECPFFRDALANIGEDVRPDEPGSGMYLIKWLCWDGAKG